jgi:hypothetical protein
MFMKNTGGRVISLRYTLCLFLPEHRRFLKGLGAEG